MRALAYIRRSTRSDERTASIEEQGASIRRYCDLHGLELLEPSIIDDGVSGGDDSRFARILNTIHLAQAKALVVYHDDRLARSASRSLDFVRTLTGQGVQVHTASRGRVEVSSSDGLLATGIHAVIAEHNRLLTGEKTRAALRLRRDQGRRYCNIPPYGRRLGEGNALVEDKKELQLIKRLQELRQTGLSIRRCSETLAEAGFLSRSGRPLAP